MYIYRSKYPAEIEYSKFHGKSERKIRTNDVRQACNLKCKFGNRHFWAEEYDVITVGINEEAVKIYI